MQTTWVRCCVFAGALALIAGPAMARPVDDAQKYIIDQTAAKKNFLKNDCDPLNTKNSKNVCFLPKYPDAIFIGATNGRKAGEVKTEYDTLVTLAQWNANVAAVGSQFLEKIPCSKASEVFSCVGFTEQKLSGSEVHWASFYIDLVEKQSKDKCEAESYRAKVINAYNSGMVVNNGTLSSFVHGKSENWRKALSAGVTSLGKIFEREESSVIDLQAFVADNGNMHVLDSQGLDKTVKAYTCWSRALAIFGELIASGE